jgi:succinate dehydrogenase / fumarate reductase iron-sulfur subunit
MGKVTFRIWRGDKSGGQFREYAVEVSEGMVVLDAVHQIQATQAPDLACRWNCKAGKCGSCSAEVNGKPRLMCMTRMDALPTDQPILLQPLKTFPLIRDLVTDVSWNYRVNRRIPAFRPRPPDAADGTWRMGQEEVDRIQEFRKCIECFLCQDVCHVLREHKRFGEPELAEGGTTSAPAQAELFAGPRFLVRVASLEMHPLDTINRLPMLQRELNIGLCNITKCCTEVCPENIHITDNAIIPLKERVVDDCYDPLMIAVRKVGEWLGWRQKKSLPMADTAAGSGGCCQVAENGSRSTSASGR